VKLKALNEQVEKEQQGAPKTPSPR
jgi:hypothetical protein